MEFVNLPPKEGIGDDGVAFLETGWGCISHRGYTVSDGVQSAYAS